MEEENREEEIAEQRSQDAWEKHVDKKETTLSEKIENSLKGQHRVIYDCYPHEDVKEFIRREADLVRLLITRLISPEEFWKMRDKLAGEKQDDWSNSGIYSVVDYRDICSCILQTVR